MAFTEKNGGVIQNSFTLKKFCDGICSINTLKNIEAGGLSRSEDVYIELLDKLDLKFGEFPVIDEVLDRLLMKLYKAIEFYDIDEIELVSDKMIRVLKEVNKYVYYSEVESIVNDLRDYYFKDGYIDDVVYQKYRSILYQFELKYMDLLRILMFPKIECNSINNHNEYIEEIEFIKLSDAKLSCIRLNLLHYYYTQNKYLEMKNEIESLESHFMRESNHIRLLDTYNYAIVMLTDVNIDWSSKYLNRIEELVSECNLPKIKICEVYANIGCIFHMIKDYAKSLVYYEKMLTYGFNTLTNLIYMADCQNRLGRPIKMPIIENFEYDKYPIDLKCMFKYFTLSEDTPVFIKQNYILKKILPYLHDKELIEIFRFELLKLLNYTNQYKLLHVFETGIQQKF
ncbi:hypothetical protein [[Clostridium] innocuum]|uniref:hypothetical protein n=1 Tax=Clostridium innocuum TaxID=1522 RepID=UPI001FF16C78|nr:hypothetical protein [[Clostridium] innocuum]UOX51148.1 hypothetical protein K5I27_03995 [[Clostridium] innocuum]